ncbi:hypothetical protein [Curtobacterium sp. MCBA15_001]|uniref:hypothetical protein n=1 Tax=Curtobacterium sp. MCBA15_001 TaxID=1898731 RepID=UPI0015878357|nr:hypothetical protein [Curtobacterium sp. MCBA15_001]
MATTAKVRSLQERRATLVDRLYTRAERILDRLEEGDGGKFRALVRGEGGSEHDETLDFIPTQAERDLTAAVSGYLTTSAKLILQDPSEGLTEAHSLLDTLAAGFAAAAVNYDPAAGNALGDAS